jgi:outer membrane lipoprotein-sorting protein
MAMRSRTRVVAVLVVLAMLAVFGVSVSRANPSPPLLPAVSPARLLASSLTALEQPYSIAGDVRTNVDLGLPQIPSGVGGSGPASVASLIGTQRFKVWRSPDGVRVAHIVDFGEQTIVGNRTSAWLWDSTGMTAEHVVYANLRAARGRAEGPAWLRNMTPSGTSGTSDAAARSRALAMLGNPAALARDVLRGLAPYAHVTVDGTARVAGRPVYRLDLTPSSPLTLIGRISVSIDAQTRLPLDVQVVAKDETKPSLEAGFTSVSFGSIDPSMFTFTPPSGATVTTPSLPAPRPASAPAERRAPETRVFGSGFAARLAIRLHGSLPGGTDGLLPYAGPLGSALVVHESSGTWLIVGFVGLDTLRSDAARLT